MKRRPYLELRRRGPLSFASPNVYEWWYVLVGANGRTMLTSKTHTGKPGKSGKSDAMRAARGFQGMFRLSEPTLPHIEIKVRK